MTPSERVAAYRVLDCDEQSAGGWSDDYSVLVGPGDFECALTEPEDKNWYRDGAPVVARLNSLTGQLATAQATIERLQGALGDAVEHMQWMTGGINLGVRVEKETLVLIRAGIDKARAALQAEATGEGEKHGSAQIHN